MLNQVQHDTICSQVLEINSQTSMCKRLIRDVKIVYRFSTSFVKKLIRWVIKILYRGEKNL